MQNFFERSDLYRVQTRGKAAVGLFGTFKRKGCASSCVLAPATKEVDCFVAPSSLGLSHSTEEQDNWATKARSI